MTRGEKACFGLYGFGSGFGSPCHGCGDAYECSQLTDLLTCCVGNRDEHLVNYLNHSLMGEEMKADLGRRANSIFMRSWGGDIIEPAAS